jgi:hypothetical protein
MAHLNVSLDFDSDSETATGDGWRVIHWFTDEAGTSPDQFTDLYATLTAAQAAIEELFSSDPEVDKYFYDKAVVNLVGSSSTSLDADKQAMRVAEGLDADLLPG